MQTILIDLDGLGLVRGLLAGMARPQRLGCLVLAQEQQLQHDQLAAALRKFLEPAGNQVRTLIVLPEVEDEMHARRVADSFKALGVPVTAVVGRTAVANQIAAHDPPPAGGAGACFLDFDQHGFLLWKLGGTTPAERMPFDFQGLALKRHKAVRDVFKQAAMVDIANQEGSEELIAGWLEEQSCGGLKPGTKLKWKGGHKVHEAPAEALAGRLAKLAEGPAMEAAKLIETTAVGNQRLIVSPALAGLLWTVGSPPAALAGRPLEVPDCQSMLAAAEQWLAGLPELSPGMFWQASATLDTVKAVALAPAPPAPALPTLPGATVKAFPWALAGKVAGIALVGSLATVGTISLMKGRRTDSVTESSPSNPSTASTSSDKKLTVSDAKMQAKRTSWPIPKDEQETAKLKQAAERGDEGAMFCLGTLHQMGKFVPQDLKAGEKWLARAAEAGSTDAMLRLCRMFRDGDGGLPVDPAEAEKWARRACQAQSPEGFILLGGLLTAPVRKTPERAKEGEEAYAKARELALPCLETGDHKAMFAAAIIYDEGLGVETNHTQAADWFRKAANKGHVLAMWRLGTCYARGKGVPKDDTIANEWLRKAADAGNSRSLGALGQGYEEGKGTPKDEAKAVELYLRAADMGLCEAMDRIGTCYSKGIGVAKDDVKAFSWHQKAAILGSSYGMNNLAKCYNNGRGVTKDQRKAFEWHEKAAAANNLFGMVQLAYCYQDGTGVTKDKRKAFEWWDKAAKAGNSDAMHCLGICYSNGLGVARDDSEAVKWQRKAAEANNSGAMTSLGFHYGTGRGIAKDDAEAFKWFQKAADAGNSDGMNNLGFLYSNGNGVPKDERKAFEWFQKAADAGSAMGNFNLGYCYDMGTGVSKDADQAIQWYQKAARLGDEQAQRALKDRNLSW